MRQNTRGGASRAPLVAGIVFAVALLGGVNFMMQRSTPIAAEHDDDHEGADSKSAADSTSPSAAPAAKGSQLVDLGDDKAIGSPGAPTEVTIGWKMTPQVQADPSKVYEAVSIMQQVVSGAGGKFRARIVNVDVHPSVPAGISFGGKTQVPLGADGSIDTQKMQYVLQNAMR